MEMYFSDMAGQELVDIVAEGIGFVVKQSTFVLLTAYNMFDVCSLILYLTCILTI